MLLSRLTFNDAPRSAGRGKPPLSRVDFENSQTTRAARARQVAALVRQRGGMLRLDAAAYALAAVEGLHRRALHAALDDAATAGVLLFEDGRAAHCHALPPIVVRLVDQPDALDIGGVGVYP